jgi:hypothetical protein
MTSDEEIDDTQGFLSFISTSEVLLAAIIFCQIGGVYATDLVDLQKASPVLRTGQLLYAANEAVEENFYPIHHPYL